MSVEVMQLQTVSARSRLSLVQCARSAACLEPLHSGSIKNALVCASCQVMDGYA